MNIISRAEAKSQGLKRYFTGKACPQDHICERKVNAAVCVECAKMRIEAWRRVSPVAKAIRDRIKARHRAKYLLVMKQYRRNNAEWISAKKSTYNKANRHLTRETERTWRAANRYAVNERQARRNAAKLSATPEWADLHLIQEFYREARRLTDATGVLHHVDHIVPLNSPLVCGLHVHHNLQVLTGPDNDAKGNRFWPDMFPPNPTAGAFPEP